MEDKHDASETIIRYELSHLHENERDTSYYTVLTFASQLCEFLKVGSIRTPVLIKGRLERTEINLMHFKWKVS